MATTNSESGQIEPGQIEPGQIEPGQAETQASSETGATRSGRPRPNPISADEIASMVDQAQVKDSLAAAERQVARKIDPGKRALVVAIAVLVLIVSFALPHTGDASGLDVITDSSAAHTEQIVITSQLFVWFLALFGILASGAALLTRSWVIAWIATAGCSIAIFLGVLAVWSRQTPGAGDVIPANGPGAGLLLGWAAVTVLAFHWARAIWERSVYQLSIADERRQADVAWDSSARRLRRLQTGRDD